MTPIEHLLRNAWDAGFKEGSEYAGNTDMTLDSLFENYMEKFCEELGSDAPHQTPEELNNADDQ